MIPSNYYILQSIHTFMFIPSFLCLSQYRKDRKWVKRNVEHAAQVPRPTWTGAMRFKVGTSHPLATMHSIPTHRASRTGGVYVCKNAPTRFYLCKPTRRHRVSRLSSPLSYSPTPTRFIFPVKWVLWRWSANQNFITYAPQICTSWLL